MSRTHFRPETDGFAFANNWTFDAFETNILKQLVTDAVDVIAVALAPLILVAEAPVLAAEGLVPIIGPWLVYKTIQAQTDAVTNSIVGSVTAGSYGLCGGMAFASLDYWKKNWVMPRGTDAKDQPQRTSPTGTALRDYIWTRLLDSVKNNVGTFLEWMAILAFDSSGATTLRDRTLNEVAKLKSQIGAGTPVTVGLVGTTLNPMDNHQVLVYGFDSNADGTTTLFVYDNNNPGAETTYKMDFTGPALQVTENQPTGARGPMRGLFCTAYAAAIPPRTVVLTQGLAVSPKVTGAGNPVSVAVSASNIGYHTSPALTLVIAPDAGLPVTDAAPLSIAEGSVHALAGKLSIPSQGNRKIGVVASLGTFAGVVITKFLPAMDANETAAGSVVIVGERLIDADVATRCGVSGVVGSLSKFSVRVDDMGGGLTFAWKAVGGVITSGATSQEVEVQMPALAGSTVALSVTVTRPDGGMSAGSYAFDTITAAAAGLQTVMCEFESMMTQAPFQTTPGDPGPDGGRVLKPGDILVLSNIASQLSQAAAVATRAGGAMTLSTIGASHISVPALRPTTLGDLPTKPATPLLAAQ